MRSSVVVVAGACSTVVSVVTSPLAVSPPPATGAPWSLRMSRRMKKPSSTASTAMMIESVELTLPPPIPRGGPWRVGRGARS
ncbi:MAG: hypothetical protein ACKORC_07310 [Acidimicrobiia bacterium]